MAGQVKFPVVANISMSKEMKNALTAAALQQETSEAALVRRALRRELELQGK